MEMKVVDRDITSCSTAKSGTRYAVIPKRMIEALGIEHRAEISLVEIDGETALLVKPFKP